MQMAAVCNCACADRGNTMRGMPLRVHELYMLHIACSGRSVIYQLRRAIKWQHNVICSADPICGGMPPREQAMCAAYRLQRTVIYKKCYL